MAYNAFQTAALGAEDLVAKAASNTLAFLQQGPAVAYSFDYMFKAAGCYQVGDRGGALAAWGGGGWGTGRFE